MDRSRRYLIAGAIAVGAGILIGALLLRSPPSEEELTLAPEPEPSQADIAIRWKVQSIWQAGTINQEVFVRFCDRVTAMSGGRLIIEPLSVGAVVAYHETLDAVSAGILDGQNGGTGYFSGKDAAFALLADLNGAYESPRQILMWLEYGGGLELARELFAHYGLYYIGGVPWAAESIPAKAPIRTIEDFQGVKIRAPEGMSQEIFASIGAAPVNLPGAEVYTALERGVVDAADWGSIGMNDELGFHQIAPYPLYPGFHSLPITDVAVRQERWDELPDDLQRIVTTAVRTFALDMVETIAMQDAEVVRDAEAKGIELIRWSDADRRTFREAAQKVWAEYGARSEMAGRIYESQLAFLRQIGLLDQ